MTWRSLRCAPILLTLLGGTVSAQMPGDSAPLFALKTLAGVRDSLRAYRGRPVLVNFWASWCKPCRAEMSWIVAAYAKHQAAGLAVLAVNLTDQEVSAKEVRKFVDEFQMSFPVLLDERGKVRRHYGLRGIPTSVFIDADGVVRAVNPGPLTEEALAQHLGEILNRQEGTP